MLRLHAAKIWATSPFTNIFSTCQLRSILDDVLMIQKCNNARLSEFIAIMWSCWNSRNDDLFHNRILSPTKVIAKALDFVKEFRAATDHFAMPLVRTPSAWEAPSPGLVKINFNGASWANGVKAGESSVKTHTTSFYFHMFSSRAVSREQSWRRPTPAS